MHPKRQPPPKPEPGQVCTRCGERPAVGGRFSCQGCIDRIERQAEEWKAKRSRAAAGPGPCEHCGRTVEVAGHRYCDDCRARDRSKRPCEGCGRPVFDGAARCPKCEGRDKCGRKARAARDPIEERAEANELCLDCARPVKIGFAYCVRCAKQRREEEQAA